MNWMGSDMPEPERRGRVTPAADDADDAKYRRR